VSVDELPDDETVITLRNGILLPDAETVAANGYEAPPLGALVPHADIYLIGAGAGRGTDSTVVAVQLTDRRRNSRSCVLVHPLCASSKFSSGLERLRDAPSRQLFDE
jgi:hypothetical protein